MRVNERLVWKRENIEWPQCERPSLQQRYGKFYALLWLLMHNYVPFGVGSIGIEFYAAKYRGSLKLVKWLTVFAFESLAGAGVPLSSEALTPADPSGATGERALKHLAPTKRQQTRCDFTIMMIPTRPPSSHWIPAKYLRRFEV